MGVSSEYLKYINQNATRRQPLVPELEGYLADAVSNVYGPGYTAQIYSGGQPGKGEGPRVGSVRHDHGKAADVYIVGPDGKRVTGDALAPLAQYWQAKKYGGTGLEMKGGGIHLDMWAKPPPGGAMTWDYGGLTPAQERAMALGQKGQLPTFLAGNSTPATAPIPPAQQMAMAGAPIPAPAPQNNLPAMAGGDAARAAMFPEAPVQKQGLIPMLQSGQPLNMETAKTFLGGAEGPMAGMSAGLGLLAQGLGAGQSAPQAPPPPPIEAHDPDLSLLALLDPKRKRMMA